MTGTHFCRFGQIVLTTTVDNLMEVPSPVRVLHHTFDIQFHPKGETTGHLFVSCHVSGHILLWKLESSTNTYTQIGKLKHHTESCRAVRFFPDGQRMISGSADHRCAIVDMNGKTIWVTPANTTEGHQDPVNVITVLDDKLFASGDDDGCLKIWDPRMIPVRPVVSFHEYKEYISDIQYDPSNRPNSLVSTSGDCLELFDMRMPNPKLEAMSDPQETDLLCCRIVKGGKKIICGTANGGFISVFNWENIGDIEDRIPGHGVSVDQILPVSDMSNDSSTVVITGAGDGLIRLVKLFPTQVLGSLGNHNDDEDPIEVLGMNSNKQLLVSGSHDGYLRFHSTALVNQMVNNGNVSVCENGEGRKPLFCNANATYTNNLWSFLSRKTMAISSLQLITSESLNTCIALGANLISSGQWSIALWGPHVTSAWALLRVDSDEEREIEMFKLEDARWGVMLYGLPSLESLREGKIKYQFVIESSWNDCYHTEGSRLRRRDPYSRQVEFDSNWSYFLNAHSDWRTIEEKIESKIESKMPQWNQLIIYELHVGTFVNSCDAKQHGSNFEAIIPRLQHIKNLGFTAIELMPVQEFGGVWGYNPRLLGAIHSFFGTPYQLRKLVFSCHQLGLFVIFDIVLNHGSFKMNSLWNWDGYGPNGDGGVYFEGGGETGWGRKFAFHRREVREMLKSTAHRFADEFRGDGIRFDSVHNMPNDLLQEITHDLRSQYPEKILIAEVTPENPEYCRITGFDSCWIHSNYYDIIKILRYAETDHHMGMLKAMIQGHKGFDKSHNSITSNLGTHDQIGNRHPHGHSEDTRIGKYFIEFVGGRESWDARAQCRLWYSLMVTSRPLPMCFMGTETLQMGWWNPGGHHDFQWSLVDGHDPYTQKFMNMVKDINNLRLELPELHDDDHRVCICHEDFRNRIIGIKFYGISIDTTWALSAYPERDTVETAPGDHKREIGEVLVLVNTSSKQFQNDHESAYNVKTPWNPGTRIVQIFNSNAEDYGGWDDSWLTQKWRIPNSSSKPEHVIINQDQCLAFHILPKLNLSIFIRL